ncbi:MAG: hypothetical protein P8008_01940 [Gammaproteobacteria bacterium]
MDFRSESLNNLLTARLGGSEWARQVATAVRVVILSPHYRANRDGSAPALPPAGQGGAAAQES